MLVVPVVRWNESAALVPGEELLLLVLFPHDGHALAARNDPRHVIADPHAPYFGYEVGERTLVPDDTAQLGGTVNGFAAGTVVFTGYLNGTCSGPGAQFANGPDEANGDQRSVSTDPLAAGSYTFVCDVHPNMTGTLTAS